MQKYKELGIVPAFLIDKGRITTCFFRNFGAKILIMTFRKLKYAAFPVLAAFLFLMGFSTVKADDHTRHVNLFIGTAGHGHTHPAAVVPHGMIQPGPDTRRKGWDACSGYHYTDTLINGFAHTRLSGTGCADLGDFLVMPVTGTPDILDREGAGQGYDPTPWASSFSHSKEWAEPGYYAVDLDRYGIHAEMSATERAAIHRYTFPKGEKAGLILDLDYAIQEQLTLEVDAQAEGNVLKAHRRSYWWAYNQELYFYAVFSSPFTCTTVTDTVDVDGYKQPRLRMVLQFTDKNAREIMMRAAISSVDYDGAARNLEAEIPDFDFDHVRKSAHDKWEKELADIDITPAEGNASTLSEEQLTIFYTSLYHTALAPSLFSDVDGRYRGNDLKIHAGDSASPQYTVFSLWDTFRALHPLLSITHPERNEAYLRSLVTKGKEGGVVPKWDCSGNYTACMPGYHFVSLAADAYAKGYRNFDIAAALQYGMKAAQGNTEGISSTIPAYKVRELLPEGRRLKQKYGYIPCDLEGESVAKALEYAYDDYCISILAKAVENMEAAKEYESKAGEWTQYFDKSIRFMRGLDSKGKRRTPFDPRRSEHRADDYCEGTAWQWTWFVPHDVDGLIKAMGGKQAFSEKLDSLFTASSEMTGNVVSSDISGLIGQYAHGNEPGHHIAYLYNYAGNSRRTQEVCDTILHSLYANAPEGLAGNEDCGAMSAWYVLSAAGLYQVCPGKPVWTIGRPLFSRATFHLPEGKTFTILARNNGPKAKYVRRMTLNGKKLKTPFLNHEDIAKGGTLVLTMSEK